MKKHQREYEEYVRKMCDRFSEGCAVKHDYTDYCNCIQGNSFDTRYNFRQADDRTLVDMLISGEFDREDVKKVITKRQNTVKKWFVESFLTYDEWIADGKPKGDK